MLEEKPAVIVCRRFTRAPLCPRILRSQERVDRSGSGGDRKL